jgi:hypothetical protein
MDEEMLTDFNMLKCETPDCAKEKEEIELARDVALRGDWAGSPTPMVITSASPTPEETPVLALGSGVKAPLSKPSHWPSQGQDLVYTWIFK